MGNAGAICCSERDKIDSNLLGKVSPRKAKFKEEEFLTPGKAKDDGDAQHSKNFTTKSTMAPSLSTKSQNH